MTTTGQSMAAGHSDSGAAQPAPAGGHAHDDDHAADHAEPALGPIDWGAWAVSAVGVAAGVLVALVLFVAIQHG